MPDLTFIHPANCDKCKGTLIEYAYKQERDGYTCGFRYCSNLKVMNVEPVLGTERIQQSLKWEATADGLCGQMYLLPGLLQTQYNAGGVPCELKHGHKGNCRVSIEQETQTVTMEIPEEFPEKAAKIVSTKTKEKKL